MLWNFYQWPVGNPIEPGIVYTVKAPRISRGTVFAVRDRPSIAYETRRGRPTVFTPRR